MSYTIRTFTGSAISPWLEELARLRITVFREWPYLYAGDEDYEKRYLQVYVDSPRSILALVFDGAGEGARVIGATTGLPLSDEADEFQQPFREHGFAVERIFYFGESVVEKAHRGNGFGPRFFQIRENHAREVIPDLQYTTFCAVQRPEDHPLRPGNARFLDNFWLSMGYNPHAKLTTRFAWKDLGEDEETEKPLQYWLKPA